MFPDDSIQCIITPSPWWEKSEGKNLGHRHKTGHGERTKSAPPVRSDAVRRLIFLALASENRKATPLRTHYERASCS